MDETKRRRYPSPTDELRVSDDILRTRCGVMVAGSAKRIEFTDEALQKNAMEEF